MDQVFKGIVAGSIALVMMGCGGGAGGGGGDDNNDTNASIPLPTLSVHYTDGHSGELTVSLSDVNTTTLSKITVYRNTSDDAGGKTPVHTFTTLASSLTFTDQNLTGCQEYYYWVEACADPSGTETCRIGTQPVHDTPVPDAPKNVKVDARVIRSLNMHWQNNSDNDCTVKYHIYKRTTPSGDFVHIPEINDLTSGTDGATATNVNAGVYIHYRVQAEDGDGRKSSLSCSVAAGYPQYGVDVNDPQDPCRAAVGYTWGDQPHYPWASYNGYTNKVVFTWDDVPLMLNDDGTVKTYANYYSIRYRIGSGSWSGYYDVADQNFTYNGARYQQVIVPDDIPGLSTVASNTTVEMEISTKYNYDNDGDGTPETTYSSSIYITGKTAASSSSTSSLGTPPSSTASTYYPGKIMVGWTSSSGATYYELWGKNVTGSGSCPVDSNNPNADGYSKLTLPGNTNNTTYNHMVSWQTWCYRVRACNANGCGLWGSHAYGSSTGN